MEKGECWVSEAYIPLEELAYTTHAGRTDTIANGHIRNNQRKGLRARGSQKKLLIAGIVTAFAIGIGIGFGIGHARKDSGCGTFEQLTRPVTLSPRPCGNSCEPPDRWVQYNNTAFYYSEDNLDWFSSKRFCEDQGAVLAITTDPSIEENINRFTTDSGDYWIGAYKVDGKKVWLNESMEGDEWLKGVSIEQCVTWSPAEIYEDKCTEKMPFICIRFQNGDGTHIA